MGIKRQTKFTGNCFWTDVLLHNRKAGPGSSPSLAIDLTVDGQYVNYDFKAGEKIWVKWTSPYSDQIDFYVSCNGLNAITNDISNYSSFQADHVTPVSIGNQTQNYHAGSGPDPQGRETWFAFLNFFYQNGETYYASLTVPFAGNYGLLMQGD